MSTYDICIDREAQSNEHKIRRPIPRHPLSHHSRLIPKISTNTNSCEHNCQCIHTANNPPAPTLPHAFQASHVGPTQQLAVENHYIVTTSSEHSQMTSAVCACECGSSVQGLSSLQSGRSSATVQQDIETRRCHHQKQ